MFVVKVMDYEGVWRFYECEVASYKKIFVSAETIDELWEDSGAKLHDFLEREIERAITDLSPSIEKEVLFRNTSREEAIRNMNPVKVLCLKDKNGIKDCLVIANMRNNCYILSGSGETVERV